MDPMLMYLLIGFAVGIIGATVVFLFTRPPQQAEGVVLKKIEILEGVQEREERMLREEMVRARQENANAAKIQREELRAALMGFTDTFATQTSKLTESNEQRLESLRSIVDLRLKQLQDDNSKQLEKVRATVDEKLQGTLEKRLGESFKLVSDRLEQVHQGLGAMQQLANDVGGLQRVLTNVKTRGGWSEWQLGVLLEEMLPPNQFAKNVKTRDDTDERVDFAIKLPGKKTAGNGRGEIPVWLPIDAKFPMEHYDRLTAAQEKADSAAVESATKTLETELKRCAKSICEKYINPPSTTDFALLFLPSEGLYAEAIRRVGLVQSLQRDCRVTFVGPTTLAALLNSLQMGFHTLAIEQQSSKVWQLLSVVKAEFGKFSVLLDGVKRKLDQASNTMEDAARKSRTIEKKLRNVEELPPAEAKVLLKDLIPEPAGDDA